MGRNMRLRFQRVGINVAVDVEHGLSITSGRIQDVTSVDRPGALYGVPIITLGYDSQLKLLASAEEVDKWATAGQQAAINGKILEFSLYLYSRKDYLAVAQSKARPLVDQIVAQRLCDRQPFDCAGQEPEIAMDLLTGSLQIADKYGFAPSAGMPEQCLILSQEEGTRLGVSLPSELDRTEFGELILSRLDSGQFRPLTAPQ